MIRYKLELTIEKNYKYIRIEDMQIEGTEIFIEKVDLTIFTKRRFKNI